MKYRLLKDLPSYPAGRIFWKDKDGWKHESAYVNYNHISAILESFHDDPEWFEPAPTAKKFNFAAEWRELGHVNRETDPAYYMKASMYTLEQAIAIQGAISALMDYIHTPYAHGDYSEYLESLKPGEEAIEKLNQAHSDARTKVHGKIWKKL